MTYLKEIKFNGKTLSININSDADDSVFNEIFVEREYREVEEIIKNSQNYIIDIGGHTGMFSIYVRELNQNISIFTFEPEEKNYKALKENFLINHIKGVFSKNLAVSGKKGDRLLYLSSDSHNHSLINESDNNEIKTQKIQSTSLQDIIEKANKILNKSYCDLVKMDCEGAEFEIIEETPLEVFQKIKNIYIEYHKYLPSFDPQKIKQKLEQTGFKVTSKPSMYDKRMGTIFAKR